MSCSGLSPHWSRLLARARHASRLSGAENYKHTHVVPTSTRLEGCPYEDTFGGNPLALAGAMAITHGTIIGSIRGKTKTPIILVWIKLLIFSNHLWGAHWFECNETNGNRVWLLFESIYVYEYKMSDLFLFFFIFQKTVVVQLFGTLQLNGYKCLILREG